jgi:hypothetical protein
MAIANPIIVSFGDTDAVEQLQDTHFWTIGSLLAAAASWLVATA